MASSVFPRFLRNQSDSVKRIIPLLSKEIIHETPLLSHLFESDNRPSQSFFLAQLETKNSSISPSPRQFYPSFSAGLFLNPISSTGLIERDVSDDSPTIWADSVKKKRKRKMNKHKLRKLRKRLRRKT